MYTKGDFHLHTKASDGKLSSEELVNLAKKEGIDIIAVTDHDTTGGIDKAIITGQNIGVKVIPGIELSTLYENKNVHILGYFKDREQIDSNFKSYLKELNDYRIYRGEKIIKNLDSLYNIKLDYKSILEKTHGIIARPHIAKAIVDAGYDYSWNYIFENLIGDNSPAYVPNKKLATEDGLKLFQSVGALTILAHPVFIQTIELDKLLQLPFHGIEAIYPANTAEDTEKFIAYAIKYNKVISAGSDFHGITKDDSKHAATVGEVFLDEKGIDAFLHKLNEI
ncbi:PHP domain-containing protein [Clostridiaceae bacterium UIB06]|nr:PHP domain-containing protein [Clostridiaceae bacterium UIB06]